MLKAYLKDGKKIGSVRVLLHRIRKSMPKVKEDLKLSEAAILLETAIKS